MSACKTVKIKSSLMLRICDMIVDDVYKQTVNSRHDFDDNCAFNLIFSLYKYKCTYTYIYIHHFK